MLHKTAPFNLEFVAQQLHLLKTNKSVGLDRITAPLLRDSAEVITPILTKIFNTSLLIAKFPSLWKCGKVIALFMSGDGTSCSNYRPITILPVVSKILENVVHQQVYSHLGEHDIINPDQFDLGRKR